MNVRSEAQREVRCADEGSQQVVAALEAADMPGGDACQRLWVVGCEVGQGVALEIPPEGLDRIELRGIGWKEVHVQARMAGEPLADVATAVDRQTIPDQDHSSPQVAQERVQEGDDPGAGDVAVRCEGKVQSHAAPPG